MTSYRNDWIPSFKYDDDNDGNRNDDQDNDNNSDIIDNNIIHEGGNNDVIGNNISDEGDNDDVIDNSISDVWDLLFKVEDKVLSQMSKLLLQRIGFENSLIFRITDFSEDDFSQLSHLRHLWTNLA